MRLLLLLLLCPFGLFVQSSSGQAGLSGDRFWVAFLPNAYSASVLELWISSAEACSGTVQLPGYGWSQSFQVDTDTIMLVVVPVSAIPDSSEVVQHKGVLIEATGAIGVVALNRTSSVGSMEATTVLPERLLGREHVIISYAGWNYPQSPTFEEESGFVLVASADSTLVEIVPNCQTQGGLPPDVAHMVLMNAGDTYYVEADTTYYDMTGMTVRVLNADGCHGIGVFAGVSATVVGMSALGDHIYEQMHPVSGWGKRYSIASEDPPWPFMLRILAWEDSTLVSIDGASAQMIQPGEVMEVVDVQQPICIEADKPIAVAQFISRFSVPYSGPYLDPSYVILPGQDMPASSISFYVAESFSFGGGPLNDIDYLTIVIDGGQAWSVVLDGTAIPVDSFTAFPACPDRLWFDQPIGDGMHTITSSVPFQAYVYNRGYNEGSAIAFGLPASAVMDSTVCAGAGQLLLSAPAGLSDPIWVTWDAVPDTLFIGESLLIDVNEGGTYVVQDGMACGAAVRYHVEINEPLSVTLAAVPDTLCAEGQSILTITSTPTYDNPSIVWLPEGLSPPGQTEVPTNWLTSSQIFSCTVTSPLGCRTGVDSTWVVVLPSTVPEVFWTGSFLSTSAIALTYQWFLNGEPIQGATGQSYGPVASGTYTVMCGYLGGCFAMSEAISWIVGTAEVANPSAMACWPQPAADDLAVAGIPKGASLRLFDIEGRLLWSREGVVSDTLRIDLRRLRRGVYMLVASTADVHHCMRVIKD